MVVAKKTTRTTPSKATKTTIHKHLEDQPLELLSPEEFNAIAAASYENPESRIILRLFIHVNYFWHVSRHMQGLPSAVKAVDWSTLETNAAQSIRNTFSKLLPGIQTTAWDGKIPEKYKKV